MERLLLLVLLIVAMSAFTTSAKLYPQLASFANEVTQEFDQISPERKEVLDELADFIRARQEANEEVKLTVICTHNSRRSHMGQLWALTAAAYYGVANITAYSGGTEATAFNPRAVAAMKKMGFQIEEVESGKNPIYTATYAEGAQPITMYSKKFDDEANPQEDFVAIMVCSEADEACPIVRGAALRLSLPFEDPKAYDGTDLEAAKYEERAKDIARELFYVFSTV